MAKRGEGNSGKAGDRQGKEGRQKTLAPDEADAALWHRLVAGVRPLRSRRRPAISPPLVPKPAAPVAEVVKPQASASPKPAPIAKPPPKPALPELSPRAIAGVDKRTAQRLARGQLAIEARLDLHGLTQDEAHARLAAFIRRSAAAGQRCVLVITGKGYKPTGETGVLRRSVPRWLNEPGLRRSIVALRTAQPKDGGEGALYVLLRRERAEPTAAKDAPAPKRLARTRMKP